MNKANEERKLGLRDLAIKYTVCTCVASVSTVLLTAIIGLSGFILIAVLNAVLDSICLVLMSSWRYDRLYKRLCDLPIALC